MSTSLTKEIKLRKLWSCLLILVGGCNQNPVVPTSVVLPLVVAYEINIPTPEVAHQLQQAFPDGIKIAPMTAQLMYDYTAAYGGSPNVYFGSLGIGAAGTYIRTGITIAPEAAASKDIFTGADWPELFGDQPTRTFQWVGRFVHTRAIL